MEKIYIVAARRSAIGSNLGSLSSLNAADLGALVVKTMLSDANIPSDIIDECIVGNVLSAGIGQGPARQVAIKAGLPETTCAYSINMVCGSGLKAVINAFNDIRSGFCSVVVAGGTEIMSGAPYLIPNNARTGIKMGHFNVTDHMLHDSLIDAYSGDHMGITAENIAEKYGITRSEQDEFAFDSQRKAIAAVDSGVFDEEIVPLMVKKGKEMISFERDEYPNRTTSPEKLAILKPAFKQDGTVTAGNSSGINDGASFVVIASESAVKAHDLKPLCEVISAGQGGVDPQYMGLGPVPATNSALKKAGLKLSDIDIIELNEAFAAQSLGVIRELCGEHGLDEKEFMKRVNINGGAIALGHPVGASGNRILVTLIHELHRYNKNYGLASLCIGGGMGTALIIKKV